MDEGFAISCGFSLVRLKRKIAVRFADGLAAKEGQITQETVPLQLHVGDHVETISFLITRLAYPIILGFTWLEKHNPVIDWDKKSVTFCSKYCLSICVDEMVHFSTSKSDKVDKDKRKPDLAGQEEIMSRNHVQDIILGSTT